MHNTSDAAIHLYNIKRDIALSLYPADCTIVVLTYFAQQSTIAPMHMTILQVLYHYRATYPNGMDIRAIASHLEVDVALQDIKDMRAELSRYLIKDLVRYNGRKYYINPNWIDPINVQKEGVIPSLISKMIGKEVYQSE
jgi:hypothetical protein